MTEDQLVELRDGTTALIRPIRPADRDRLKEGFDTADPDSIFLRFLSPHPRLTGSELDYLTSVDHDRHEALIAIDAETGQSLGTARYVRDESEPEKAEFAIGVGDRWMRIGLGTALFEQLIVRARESGIVRFTGLIHHDNVAIKELVQKVAGPFEVKTAGAGALELSVDLRTRP
jgi:GNAT superfamily N-acetyltransferase